MGPQRKLVHLQQLLLCYICLTFLFNVHFFKFFFNVNPCEITSFSFSFCNQVLAITARCCFHYNLSPFSKKFQCLAIKNTLFSFQLPDLHAFIIYFTLTSRLQRWHIWSPLNVCLCVLFTFFSCFFCRVYFILKPGQSKILQCISLSKDI